MIAFEVPLQVPNLPPKWYNPNETYAYQMESLRHFIKKYFQFKWNVQRLKDASYLAFFLP